MPAIVRPCGGRKQSTSVHSLPAQIGALIARFESQGMARALFATALAQALVAAITLIVGLGSTEPIWPSDILVLTAFFVALWVGSAWLFRKATVREQPSMAQRRRIDPHTGNRIRDRGQRPVPRDADP